MEQEREQELLRTITELHKEMRGLERTIVSLGSQLKAQISDYHDMAFALLNAFELKDGKILIANEDAAREAYRIADIYYGS